MKDTFNLRRFGLTLKWTVLTERKSIITAFIAFTTAFLALQLWSCFTIFDLTQSKGPVNTYLGMGFCLAILSFMGAYYASGITGNARQTRQRTTVLMLPASNLEKFTARLVYCCVLMPLLIYVALLGATGLRMLMELIAGHDGIIAGFRMGMDEADVSLLSSSWTNVVSNFWTASLFVLGGTFFAKRPFIWTGVTLIVGGILVTTLIGYLVMLIGTHDIQLWLINIAWSFRVVDAIVALVLATFTLFNVWLSYRLYCRLQVVQHKWFNV